jgi:hypothetical protein
MSLGAPAGASSHVTHRQSDPARFERQHAAFASLATGQPADDAAVAPLLVWLWRLPFDNGNMEVFWRLTLDGLPLASVMYSSPQPSGSETLTLTPNASITTGPARWRRRCVLACRLSWATRQLTRGSFWLAEPPPDVHLGVWVAVRLASIAAMGSGRRLMVMQQAPRKYAAQRVC